MDGAKKPRMKTFAKKSPNKKKNKRPSTSYVQYRCNVFGFANSMQLYKPMLQQRHDVCNHLGKTPFWSLIKFYMDDEIVATEKKKKSDVDLIKIIQYHEPRGITSEDVAQIFGLNNQGVELPITDKSTKNMKDNFVKTYFANQKIVKIEAYQKSIQDETPEGAKAIASIICVHVLQSLLFATFGTYITWSFITICGALDQISKYNWAKGVRDYLFKMINKSKKKRKNGKESATTSGCTTLILEQSNINQKEDNIIPSPEQRNKSSKKKENKTTRRKRKRVEAEAQQDHNITSNQAQLQFDQLYTKELMKFDAIYQKDIIGIDTTLGVEGFEEFKRCARMDQKRYLVLSRMMLYALDNLHTNSIVTNQTTGATGALNRKIEKLLQERHEDKQKIIPDLNASTEEDQNFKDPENEEPPEEDPDNDDRDPVQENATENDVAMEDPKQRHAIDHDPDENEEDQEHERKDTTTAKGTSRVQQDVQMQTPTSKDPEDQGKETAKKKTRTLKGKEQPKVQSPLNPIAKETAMKPAKNPPKKPKQIKEKLDKRYHLPASTRDYNLLEDETKENFKEYYRQEKMDYFWMQPRPGSMATELVVLKTDLTSLFVNGAIDANIIDASFYVMSENESKTWQQQNLYLPSFICIFLPINLKIVSMNCFTIIRWIIKHSMSMCRVCRKISQYFIKLNGLTLPKTTSFWPGFKKKITAICCCCPQQNRLPNKNRGEDEPGLDCDIFVIQFANQVQEEVFAKRAQIATILMNHENSYANGLKKILKDKRRQNKHGQYDDIPDEDFITLA
ncbi:DNA ligase 1-like [Pyrus ussuriensis x Pyrus communis]|uniref:DNA ligase 1-like n=1 Tax=Pyrus ussuriensis x Pyrus communis TaxID=2448454 RepID=A0A5N5HAF8_9ROSA|nr:DNA ligase 1-like [Pyrus ussuriensis x Pyrus communis]